MILAWNEILVGIFAGLSSSLIYLAFFLRVKPKIKISDQISISPSVHGEKEFLIKVVNLSKSPIIDVRAEASMANIAVVDSGEITEHTPLTLKFDHLMQLGPCKNVRKNEEYAWYFVIKNDLEEMWTDDIDHEVIFKLIAKHSVSGFERVFVKRLSDRKCIQPFEFEWGKSVEIGRISRIDASERGHEAQASQSQTRKHRGLFR